MKIPTEVLEKHDVSDADVQMFVTLFDAPRGSRILVIGAHDESTANMLASSGAMFDVTGVDLREYDANLPPCNYRFIQADFVSLTNRYLTEEINEGKYQPFDAVVALSCIEHFGLGTYNEGAVHPYYDVIAMRKIWELLRVGGRAYVTVPMGNRFLEVNPHWRSYSPKAIEERLIQDFKLEYMGCVIAAPFIVDNVLFDRTHPLTAHEAVSYDGIPPHISTVLVLSKQEVTRLAPGGR